MPRTQHVLVADNGKDLTLDQLKTWLECAVKCSPDGSAAVQVEANGQRIKKLWISHQ
jgi:hypothetical protein